MTNALVTTEWLREHIDDPTIRILEVGSFDDRDYRLGHAPGAVWAFWQELCWDDAMRLLATPAQMAKRLGALGIGDDHTVVLMSNEAQYATYAYWTMVMAGVTGVRLLDGSRTAWVAEGRPLTVEVPEPRAVDRKAGVADSSMRIGRDDLLRQLDEPGRVVVDARSPEEFRGERVMPFPKFDHGAQRKGRIPGAVHLYYKNLLNLDETFRSPDDIAATLESIGVKPDGDVEMVTYCRLSHRATLVWFAMTEILGRSRVRVYDGSWTEWGSMVGMPIET
ncbi:MAG: sulfurtransferase [Acidimicrobiia bacterium]|nr:sulfurtransferase [Acidimicrobiia bacterium]